MGWKWGSTNIVGVVRTSNFRRRPIRLGLTYSSFISVCFLLWSHFDCHLMLCVVNKFRYLHDSICLMCRVTLPWNRTLTIPYRYGIYIYYLFKLFSVFLRVDLLREGMSVFPLMEWSLCTWRGNGLSSWCFGAIWCQEILKTTLTAVLVFCGVVLWYFVCGKTGGGKRSCWTLVSQKWYRLCSKVYFVARAAMCASPEFHLA